MAPLKKKKTLSARQTSRADGKQNVKHSPIPARAWRNTTYPFQGVAAWHKTPRPSSSGVSVRINCLQCTLHIVPILKIKAGKKTQKTLPLSSSGIYLRLRSTYHAAKRVLIGQLTPGSVVPFGYSHQCPNCPHIYGQRCTATF